MNTEEMKYKYAGKSLKELAESYLDLQQLHTQMKKSTTEVWNEFDFLRRYMVEKMDEIGALTMKMEGIGRLEQRHNMSVKQKDAHQLADWLTEHGHGHLIKESINSSSLSSFIRAELAEGKEIPDDDVIEINAFDYVTIVKG